MNNAPKGITTINLDFFQIVALKQHAIDFMESLEDMGSSDPEILRQIDFHKNLVEILWNAQLLSEKGGNLEFCR